MSRIDRMFIRGVRSFGAGEEDEEHIEFDHPLTVIVGKNGAGKTSIIECLRYSTTGKYRSGATFIHDPKLAGRSEVRAHVNLEFCSIKNELLSIKRELKGKLRNGKVSQTAADAYITDIASGKVHHGSGRCKDINRDMVTLLGVSQAVLENVIFCHQEDSNWPLSEDRNVKEKFDAIFEFTNYKEALKAIKEFKNKYQKLLDVEKEKLPFYEKDYETFDEKQTSLDARGQQLKEMKEKRNKVLQDISQVEIQLEEKQIEQDYSETMKRMLNEREQRNAELQENQDNVKDRIHKLFKGTDDQLAAITESQRIEMLRKPTELQENMNVTRSRYDQIKVLTEKKFDLLKEQGRLQQGAKYLEEKQAKQFWIFTEASKKFESLSTLMPVGDAVSESDAKNFEQNLNKMVAEAENAANAKKGFFNRKLDELENDRQKCLSSKIQNEEKLKQVQKKVLENTREIDSITQRIAKKLSSVDPGPLSKLQQGLCLVTSHLKTTEPCIISEIKCQEIEAEAKRLKLDHEACFAEIDGTIPKMHKYELQHSTVGASKASGETVVKNIKGRGMKRSEESQSLSIPSCHKLNEWIAAQLKLKVSLEKELNDKHQELAQLTAMVEVQSKCHSEKNQRYQELSKTLFELCGSEDFDAVFTQSKETICRLQKEKDLDDGIQYLYNKFYNTLSCSKDTDSAPCPLCNHTFSDIEVIQVLSREILEKLEMSSRKCVAKEQNLKKELQHHQKLANFQPAKTEMDDLASKLLAINQELLTYQSEIPKTRQSIEEMELTLSKLTNDVDILQSCLNDLKRKSLLVQDNENLKDSRFILESQITTLQVQLSEIDKVKVELQNQYESEMTKILRNVDDLKSTLQDVSRSNEEIMALSKSHSKSISEINSQCLIEVEENLSQEEKNLQATNARIAKVLEDLIILHESQQELSDNLVLRKLEKEIKYATVEINTIRTQLSLECEIQQLEETLNALNAEDEAWSNQQIQTESLVGALKEDLEKSELKNAEENLRNCKQKVVTYDLTCKNSDIHYKALDKAIMRYHSVKMAGINKLIKEIWMNTYQGRDIEYIEICCDEVCKQGNRSYNYRVVACVRGQKMDMRGRCSAGQKVLASLVIRLALSETFCINCGILALDEPTANLDRHHIESLAESLTQIIGSRQVQRNFQLIIITHDENFVGMLGRSNPVDHFFRISKVDGKSKIQDHSFADIDI